MAIWDRILIYLNGNNSTPHIYQVRKNCSSTMVWCVESYLSRIQTPAVRLNPQIHQNSTLNETDSSLGGKVITLDAPSFRKIETVTPISFDNNKASVVDVDLPLINNNIPNEVSSDRNLSKEKFIHFLYYHIQLVID